MSAELLKMKEIEYTIKCKVLTDLAEEGNSLFATYLNCHDHDDSKQKADYIRVLELFKDQRRECEIFLVELQEERDKVYALQNSEQIEVYREELGK